MFEHILAYRATAALRGILAAIFLRKWRGV